MAEIGEIYKQFLSKKGDWVQLGYWRQQRPRWAGFGTTWCSARCRPTGAEPRPPAAPEMGGWPASPCPLTPLATGPSSPLQSYCPVWPSVPARGRLPSLLGGSFPFSHAGSPAPLPRDHCSRKPCPLARQANGRGNMAVCGRSVRNRFRGRLFWAGRGRWRGRVGRAKPGPEQVRTSGPGRCGGRRTARSKRTASPRWRAAPSRAG